MYVRIGMIVEFCIIAGMGLFKFNHDGVWIYCIL